MLPNPKLVHALLSLGAVVVLVGCGATTPTAGVSSPTAATSVSSPTPASSASLAVVVIEPEVWAPPSTYFVAIIGLDGRIRASVRASTPTALCCYPLVSVAGSHVYYLGGDTKLMRLDLDGSTAQVASLPGGPGDRVVMAVDPLSGRIAFGVAHIGSNTCSSPPTQPSCAPPVSTQLWVAAADGSGARKLSVNRFPVAWHAGQIVVGAAGGFIQNRGEVNPYLTSSLALVDPATGQTTNMTASCSAPGNSLTGPLVPTGIACQHFSSSAPSLTALSWDGHESVLASPLPPNSLLAALSPDGTSAAISDNGPINGTPNVDLAQNGKLTSLHVSAAPVGWFDPIHLLVNATSQQASSQGFEILDVANGSVVKIDLGGNGGFVASYGAYFASLPSE